MGNDRYYISINENELGWVYIHQIGAFETSTHLHLVNELVPGDEIKKAAKVDYKMISKELYERILEAISTDNGVAELVNEATR